MRHAVYLPPFGTFGDARRLADLAVSAEQAGWDGIFIWDHIHYERPLPFADPWVALTAMATATERIRLGPLITPLPRRRPWKVARESVTLDHLSGGRLVLGVGLGIDFWREFEAFGEPATDDRTRAELLDDGLEIITRLWSGEPASYTGRHLSIDGATFRPTPLQQPRIPIWCANVWGFQRSLRRAARYDGVMPFSPGPRIEPDDIRGAVATLHEHGAHDGFDVVLVFPASRVDEFEAAGVTWRLADFGPETPESETRKVVEGGPRPG